MAEEKELIEQCEFIHVHEDIVNQVNAAMPDEEILYDLAELFKIFGDSTRIKILYVLSEAEMCVCDIAQLLGADAVSSLPPAARAQAEQIGEIPPGRKDGVLFSGRWACEDHPESGHGTY